MSLGGLLFTPSGVGRRLQERGFTLVNVRGTDFVYVKWRGASYRIVHVPAGVDTLDIDQIKVIARQARCTPEDLLDSVDGD